MCKRVDIVLLHFHFCTTRLQCFYYSRLGRICFHRCVFRQLATRSVKILLGKLAVGRITRAISFQMTIIGIKIVFQRNKCVNVACFLYLCKRIMVSALAHSIKLHRAPLNPVLTVWFMIVACQTVRTWSSL